jgi:hypothetical protein
MPVRRLLSALVILLAVLSTLAGCQGTDPGGRSQTLQQDSSDTAPEKGLLLKTGAIQLGPGVGRNAWRWQGDGEGGF